MDISKDGTRLEEFTFLLQNRPADLLNKILIEIRNPAIFNDVYHTIGEIDVIDEDFIRYAYAAGLITKSDRKFLIEGMDEHGHAPGTK